MHRALLALALSVALPVSALASPPTPSNSIAPDQINLVGLTGGVPARNFGQFQVLIRDIANNPVPNAPVTIDLAYCPDLHICADPLDPTAVVDCPAKRVTKVTDANGSVFMTILGGSNGPGNAVELHNTGRIYWGAVLLRSPTISAFDLDGQLGVSASDLSAFLGDFANGNPFGRVDYDGDGATDAGDLSLWLATFASGSMIESCAATCP
jgi:hypothetical protein